MRASPDEWGETLEGEQLRGGSFLEQDQIQVGGGGGDDSNDDGGVLSSFLEFCLSHPFLSSFSFSHTASLLLTSYFLTPALCLFVSLIPSPLPLSLSIIPSPHLITSNHTTQSEPWQRLLELEVGNCRHRLFGGAQYHRAIREFTVNYTVDNTSFLLLVLKHI